MVKCNITVVLTRNKGERWRDFSWANYARWFTALPVTAAPWFYAFRHTHIHSPLCFVSVFRFPHHMVPGPPGPHATGIPHPAIVNPQVKHEPPHETDLMHMWVIPPPPPPPPHHHHHHYPSQSDPWVKQMENQNTFNDWIMKSLLITLLHYPS